MKNMDGERKKNTYKHKEEEEQEDKRKRNSAEKESKGQLGRNSREDRWGKDR